MNNNTTDSLDFSIKSRMTCDTISETILQHKCLLHMESWGLSIASVKVNLIAENAVRVTDCKGDSMVISIVNGCIYEDGIPANIAHA